MTLYPYPYLLLLFCLPSSNGNLLRQAQATSLVVPTWLQLAFQIANTHYTLPLTLIL